MNSSSKYSMNSTIISEAVVSAVGKDTFAKFATIMRFSTRMRMEQCHVKSVTRFTTELAGREKMEIVQSVKESRIDLQRTWMS